YRPGGTSGNVTITLASVAVAAIVIASDGATRSTCTPGTSTVPSSVVTVATTRPGVFGCSARVGCAGAGAAVPTNHSAAAIPIGPALRGDRITVGLHAASSRRSTSVS